MTRLIEITSLNKKLLLPWRVMAVPMAGEKNIFAWIRMPNIYNRLEW
jgi:hypothetical protein